MENTQQGLYGELYILEKLLAIYGDNVVNCWTGCNAETHDFYCGKDAIEIKSSSAKGPDKVKISNEYQLDNTSIIGNLYLIYIKLKKSEVDGECLSDIVNRILEKLNPNMKIIFLDKLLKIGYIHQMSEAYMVNFRVREENGFIVSEDFPKIIGKMINTGIGAVSYELSLDACNRFSISTEAILEEIDL